VAEIAIAAAISAAVSAATYTLNYLLTPKPPAQERGRLQGEVQITDSAYGAMIPVFYGTNPGGATPGGAGVIGTNILYVSDIRKVTASTPGQGGKGGRSPATTTITYYCHLAFKIGEGELALHKLFADAEVYLDLGTSTTGLIVAGAAADPNYTNATPPSPSSTGPTTAQTARYIAPGNYDANGVMTGTLPDGATFRFYSGTATQPPDPVLEVYYQKLFPTQHAAGKDVTPAYRGDSYMVIENFNLSKFGRIPTFRPKVSNKNIQIASTVLTDLATRVGLESGDVVVSAVSGTDYTVRGLPVFNRDGAQAALDTLQLAYGFDLVDADGAITATPRTATVAGTILFDDLGASEGGEEEGGGGGGDAQPVRTESEINLNLLPLPKRLDLSYFDAGRDGETATTGWGRLESDAYGAETVELNLVLRPDEADRVVRRLHDSLWAEARRQRRFTVPHTYYQIKPGQVWNVPRSQTVTERVRITEVNGHLPGVFECRGVVVSARAHTQTQLTVGGGLSGGGGTVTLPAATVLTFIDRILRDRERADGRAGYYVGGASFGNGQWTSASVQRDRGAGYEFVTELTEQATLGVATTALSATVTGTETIDVELYGTQTLPSYTAAQVAAGSGVLIAGNEIAQYQTATQLSTTPNAWRLSVISNRGAQCSTRGFAVGVRFALLNQAFKFVAIEHAEIGVARNYKGVTAGQRTEDAGAVSFTANVPDAVMTTPADYNTTDRTGAVLHTWTPVDTANVCTMTAGLTYDIYDITGGTPGTLVSTGAAQPFLQTGVAAGSYTFRFRARSTISTGAWITDTVTVTAPVGGTVGSSIAVTTKTAAYTVVDADDVILCDPTAASFTLTLLGVGARTLNRPVHVKNIAAPGSANLVTIDGNGTETINDSLTVELAAGDSLILIPVTSTTSWQTL